MSNMNKREFKPAGIDRSRHDKLARIIHDDHQVNYKFTEEWSKLSPKTRDYYRALAQVAIKERRPPIR